MRAGSLRHIVNILKPKIVKNEYGEDSITGWTTDKTVWASIEPIRGNEYFNSQQVSSVVTHRIRIRYTTLSNSTAIGPKNMIETKEGSRKFGIVSPPIDFNLRNRELEIMCKETS
jgi:SPP1 family predicted phage head-tail adaptor